MDRLQVSETNRTPTTVESFFLGMYFRNRFISPEILHFRQETFPEAVREWAKKMNLSEKDYIAIPVGSMRTLPNDQSDVDIIVIINTEREDPSKKNDYSRVSAIQNESNRMSVQEASGTDVLGIMKSTYPLITMDVYQKHAAQEGSTDKVGNFSNSYFMCNLMYTPDNFLVGNVALAREIRLRYLEFIDQFCKIEELWNNDDATIQQSFQGEIIEWKDTETVSKESGIRLRRFAKRMREVITHLNQGARGRGERWEQGIQEHLKKVKVPPYQDMRTYLIQHNGALKF